MRSTVSKMPSEIPIYLAVLPPIYASTAATYYRETASAAGGLRCHLMIYVGTKLLQAVVLQPCKTTGVVKYR